MKNAMMVFVLLYSYSIQSQSCCTSQLCSSNVGADAIEDGNYTSRIGIAYQFMNDRFALTSKISDAASISYHNQYHICSINAKLAITKRVFMNLYLPYKINQINTNQTSYYKGLGDAKIGASGILIQQTNKHTFHQLEMGADIQLPSGKYYTSESTLSNAVVIGPGTGAVLLQGNVIYRLRKTHFLFTNSFSYVFPFTNKHGLQLGQHLTDDIRIAEVCKVKKVTFVPSLYAGADYFFANKLESKKVSLSGGLMAKLGLSAEIRYAHFSTQLSWSTPVYQDLAKDKYHIKQLFSIQFNYLFSIHKKSTQTNQS